MRDLIIELREKAFQSARYNKTPQRRPEDHVTYRAAEELQRLRADYAKSREDVSAAELEIAELRALNAQILEALEDLQTAVRGAPPCWDNLAQGSIDHAMAFADEIIARAKAEGGGE